MKIQFHAERAAATVVVVLLLWVCFDDVRARAGAALAGAFPEKIRPSSQGDGGRVVADRGGVGEGLCLQDKTAPAGNSSERAESASVQGVVTDRLTRQPVAGARVSLEWGRAQANAGGRSRESTASGLTDARGRFHLGRVEPGVYSLRVAKRGYIPSPSSVLELEAAKTTAREVTLDPLSKFSGRVLDESGRPLKGAKVRVTFGPRRTSAALLRLLSEQGHSALTSTTDREGEFEVFAPTGEENVTLMARAPGYAPARLRLSPAGASRARAGVLLRLSLGFEAQGRVVNEGGTPIAGAAVLAHPQEGVEAGLESGDAESRATSGTDGRFVLRGLEKGIYQLKVSHAGHASRVVQDVGIQARTVNRLPDTVLPPEAEVSGRVADAEGRPIPGASVSAVSGEVHSSRVTSDDNGSFVLSGFAQGASIFLSATAAGHSEVSKVVSAPENGVVLVLPRHGVLRGRVEDTETLTPVKAFQIRLGVFGPKGKTFRSEEGNFEWGALPPGRWDFVATAPGYQAAEVRGIEIRAGETTEAVVFSLSKGFELAGRVVDAATGLGLPDVSVNYHPATEVKSSAWHFHASASGQQTDADGNFKFDGLPDGKVTVIAKSPFHAEARRTVAAGEESFVEIKLSKGGFVSGRVVGPDAVKPLAGARVSLSNVADGSSVTLPADESGAFSFDSLTPGRYRLTADTSLGQTKPQEIVLRENERLQNLLLVVQAGATIRGKVTGLRLEELPVVEIVAQAPGDFIGTASTAPDGTYVVRGVPKGRVEVMAQTYSGRSVSKSVEVEEGASELSLNLEFPRVARLSGRLTRGGQPAAREVVRASPRNPESAAGSGETDQSGLYVIEGLSEGDYEVVLGGEVTQSLRISGDTVLDAELSALSLAGRVSDANSGQPLSGVTLQVRRVGPAGDIQAARTVVTEASGRFSVGGLEAGQYQLAAHKRGYKVGLETLSIPAPSELTLSLTPAEGIAIRVRDGISGLALRAVTVDALSDSQPVRVNVALDETGSGELPQLAPGRYNLRVFSTGYAAKSVVGWAVPGTPLDLSLTPGGRLEISVDSAYLGVKAVLLEVNGIPPGPAQAEFALHRPTVFPHLAPGEYVLLVKSPAQTKTYKASVSEGQTTVLEVK